MCDSEMSENILEIFSDELPHFNRMNSFYEVAKCSGDGIIVLSLVGEIAGE